MKKIAIILTVSFACVIFSSAKLFSFEIFGKNDLYNSVGINLGFNTFKLLGDGASVQRQIIGSNWQSHSGGGLEYIEPGLDLSATCFIDSNLKHRAILGFEYIYMNAKEIKALSPLAYIFSYHNVQFFDLYVGYHYSFWKANFQNVKIFAGPEIMLNNILKNELEKGIRYLLIPNADTKNIYTKPSSTRLGGRIRAGFEGKIYDHLYINASFTIGIYNLLLKNNANGEHFNSLNTFETKESNQLFFNYLLSFQYRFQDDIIPPNKIKLK